MWEIQEIKVGYLHRLRVHLNLVYVKNVLSLLSHQEHSVDLMPCRFRGT